jgi:hypothetical protein
MPCRVLEKDQVEINEQGEKASSLSPQAQTVQKNASKCVANYQEKGL